MSEIRRDRLFDRVVLVAETRADRPRYWRPIVAEPSGEPCPFCPGHEHMTPPPILERPRDSWAIRVVPNRYGAVSGTDGTHEVIVDTADHEARLATMPTADVNRFLEVLDERVAHHRASGRVVVAFKNHGEAAGATIEHPHTQIVALAETPPAIARFVAAAREAADDGEACAVCQDVVREVRDGERVVLSRGPVVAFCPRVSRFPYELRVSRIDHDPRPAFQELAALLGDAARRVERVVGPVAHNVTWSFPPDRDAERVTHPIIEMWPRLGRLAGFEIASGMMINPVTPEAAARRLRGSNR